LREKVEKVNSDVLRSITNWVDGRFGPIVNLTRLRLVPPDPSWWIYTSTLTRGPLGSLYSPYFVGSAGSSIDLAEAFQRAAGEAIERYSALNAHVEGRVLTTHQNDVNYSFPRCAADEPCPPSFHSFDPDVPLTHVSVRRLADDREILIPAGYVHLNFWPHPPEPAVTLPISTGLAFHTAKHLALWRGLCEVVERDATMLMWWQRTALREVVPDGPDVPFYLADRIERLHRVNLSVRFFDMASDFRIPTVLCIVSGKRYPHITVGAACREDPAVACSKALDEAVSLRVVLRNPSFQRDLPSLEQFDWVQGLEHHALLYADKRSTSILGFLLKQNNASTSFEEFARQPWWRAPKDIDSLVQLANRLQSQGLTVLWTEVTAPEALNFGWVVKVIVPEMLPLSPAQNVRWLGTPRLLKMAGVAEASISAFNPFPHPFA
jgi:ribosomal protein S12 methylthiotransferase accessory factor